MKIKFFVLLPVVALAVSRAAAIELSLEENRGERGSIGYIDMQRLFKTFPETLRAKENFDEVVQQAEDQLNLRKTEILRLRNEISQLKAEREFIAKTPLLVSSATQNSNAIPEPAKPPVNPALPVPVTPNTFAPKKPEQDAKTLPSNLPGFGGAASSTTVAAILPAALAKSTAAAAPLVINIPGVSTAPIVAQVAPEQPAPPPAVKTSTATASPAKPGPTSAPALNPALVEIDAKIELKTRDLAQKESDYKDRQSATEKDLLDLESRKTEILLGKIYKAVQDVAHKEGVSVVVDKGNILYGHDAVDLTEKVLKYLKGSSP